MLVRLIKQQFEVGFDEYRIIWISRVLRSVSSPDPSDNPVSLVFSPVYLIFNRTITFIQVSTISFTFDSPLIASRSSNCEEGLVFNTHSESQLSNWRLGEGNSKEGVIIHLFHPDNIRPFSQRHRISGSWFSISTSSTAQHCRDPPKERYLVPPNHFYSEHSPESQLTNW